MKLFRISTLLAISGSVAAGALLFWTSQSVQQAENRLAHMQAGINSEKETIRVLNAEWDYLSSPERLEGLASEYLGLSSAAAYSVSDSFSSLPEAFVPALPEKKPDLVPSVLQARPAMLKAPSPPIENPDQDAKTFRNLLDDLSQREDVP